MKLSEKKLCFVYLLQAREHYLCNPYWHDLGRFFECTSNLDTMLVSFSDIFNGITVTANNTVSCKTKSIWEPALSAGNPASLSSPTNHVATRINRDIHIMTTAARRRVCWWSAKDIPGARTGQRSTRCGVSEDLNHLGFINISICVYKA